MYVGQDNDKITPIFRKHLNILHGRCAKKKPLEIVQVEIPKRSKTTERQEEEEEKKKRRKQDQRNQEKAQSPRV